MPSETNADAPIPHGTALFYQIEDSGMDYPHLGFFIGPEDPITVGEDVDQEFAAILVARNIAGTTDPRAPKPEPVAGIADAATPVADVPAPKTKSPKK